MDSTEKQLADMLKEFKSRSKTNVILELGVFVLILLFLFVGNSLTLLVIVLKRRMRTIPNMFVASLAVSDLCLGAFTACPIGISVLATSHWPFDDTVCQYEGYIAVSLAAASIHTLALMAVNRYFRIVKPTKYRCYFTKKKSTIMIVVLWLYSMCAPLPYFFSGHKMVFHPFKLICFLQIDSGAFTAFLVTVYLGFPTCVIFYCYLRILQTVRSHNTNFQQPGGGTSTVNVEEIKVARTLLVIVVFFSLCWTPVLVIDIVDTIRGSWTFLREAYVAYIFLATISSSLNPFIYGLMNKNFQKEYLKFFHCSYCRRQSIVKPFTLKGARGASVFTIRITSLPVEQMTDRNGTGRL